MTPHRAKARCERDLTCGGFTYKGFITNDQTQKFKIFFFHLILNYEEDLEVWNWVTYKAEREFLLFVNKTDRRAEYLTGGKLLSLESAKVSQYKSYILLLLLLKICIICTANMAKITGFTM